MSTKGSGEEAITELKRGKAVVEDRVSIEEWKLLKDAEPSLMIDLFRKVWRERKIPQEWKDMDVVTVFKNKGSRLDTNITSWQDSCKDHRLKTTDIL